MTRFTARAFRRKISRKVKKSKKSRRQTRRRGRKQRGGGNTFSRAIPENAVIANVVEWDD